MDMELVLKNIVDEFVVYIVDNDIKSVVLGISGGLDSAVVTAIAYEAKKKLIKDINYDLKIIGHYFPIESNKDDEMDRAAAIGAAFISGNGNDFLINNEPAKNYFDCLTKIDNPKTEKEKIYNGNIKARLRMITLYSLAFLNDGMVLSTDNLTEFNLGFWTLHGDVGDYGPIQQLWKTEVYELARYLMKKYEDSHSKRNALHNCICAVPTDGLGITESDYEQLGVNSYEEVDKILREWIEERPPVDSTEYYELLKSPIVERHERTEFKRLNPINISRKNIFLGAEDDN